VLIDAHLRRKKSVPEKAPPGPWRASRRNPHFTRFSISGQKRAAAAAGGPPTVAAV
jgi:hypothetical protein